MDYTYQNLLEVEEGGYGPPEPLENDTTCINPPFPRPNFSFLATMVANRPWLAVDVVAVPGAQHALPKHPEKLLLKFDPNNYVTPKDHIKQFMLSLRLLDVQHEDVVCKLFPYKFVGQASIWFFSLATGSIASWEQFETSFLNQLGDDRTSGVLVLELSRMRCDKKDKVKYFNQISINLLNSIPKKPVESIQVEFYIVALPPSIAMFVKAREKRTLAENFIEAIKVEKDIASISSSQGNEDTEKKDKDPTDMASMQRVIKQLTNELIDIKKSKGEGKKPFKPLMKKRTDFVPQIPPTSGINIKDYAMDNLCRTHHANHSERTCPEFIKYFISMLNLSEPPKKDKRSEKEEEDEDQEEKEEEEGEEPPSHLNVLWDEEDFKDEDDDDIMEEACIGNDYNL